MADVGPVERYHQYHDLHHRCLMRKQQYQQHQQQQRQRQQYHDQQQQQYNNCSVGDGDCSTASSSIESQEKLQTENLLVLDRVRDVLLCQQINHLSEQVPLSCLIQQVKQQQQQPLEQK